jgi:hypothetical protein
MGEPPDWQSLWLMVSESDGMGGWFHSRYDGYCTGCGQRYESGALIRYFADEHGYLGTCCGMDLPPS